MANFIPLSIKPNSHSHAEEAILKMIKHQGRITFADFMKIALYDHVDGYYNNGSPIGSRGDYFTSPTVHPGFGGLLARQIKRMWMLLGQPKHFYIIEIGSGNGRLAIDITNHIANLDQDLYAATKYVTIDRSQQSYLNNDKIQQILCDTLPLSNIVGCVLSNELVDAFPVHLFEIGNQGIQEIYVTHKNGAFSEELDKPSNPQLLSKINMSNLDPKNIHRGEINLAVIPWLKELSTIIKTGFILTIDYGYLENELQLSNRHNGTLQTYYKHSQGTNPYQQIGLQDITSHVNFSSIIRESSSFGIDTIGLMSQGKYLKHLGVSMWIEYFRKSTLKQPDIQANVMALRQLIDPSGLGNFKVLIQAKGIKDFDIKDLLKGIRASNSETPPTLNQNHIPIMASKYPHNTWVPDYFK